MCYSVQPEVGASWSLVSGTFNVTAYRSHDCGLSLKAAGDNLNTVSSIKAPRGTLWYELRGSHMSGTSFAEV